MKKYLLILMLLASVSFGKLSAQQLNYQGIARNANGVAMTFQEISLRLTIRDGSSTGISVYSETRLVRTNQFGLFTIVIGSPGASNISGSFVTINWITGNKFLQVEIDPAGGSAFQLAGVSELQSVPYAYFAAAAYPVGLAGGDLRGSTYPDPIIAPKVVTNGKLADTSVSTSKIIDRNVTNIKIANPYIYFNDLPLQLGQGQYFIIDSLGSNFNILSYDSIHKFNIPSASATKRGLLKSNDWTYFNNKLNLSDTAAMLLPFVQYSDTAFMISNRLKISDTATMLVNRLKISDTTFMMSRYLRKTDTASMLLPFVQYSDTTNQMVGYARLGQVVKYADTAAMLLPFVQYSDTAFMMSNRLKISDTATMLVNRLKISDTTFMMSRYLRKTDTATMLLPFMQYSDTAFMMSNRLKVSDTATMLIPFVQYSDTAFMMSNRLRITDSATMLIPFVQYSDTAFMLSKKWSTTGNTGLTASVSNYLGTTDNQPLRFKVNGTWAGELNPASSNTSFGLGAAQNTGALNRNSAFGVGALNLTTTGVDNTAIGQAALQNNLIGDNNTAVGQNALNANTGTSNTAIGQAALLFNTANFNTAIGKSALEQNINGNSNTSIGHNSATSNQGGTGNTSVGQNSLSANLAGGNNVAIGFEALKTNTTTSGNTAIGSQADVANNTLVNATAIGNTAQVATSNTVQLGNTSVTLVNTSGRVAAAKFIGNSITPSISLLSAGLLGTGPTGPTIIGNDVAGYISFTVGSIPSTSTAGSENLFDITFNSAYLVPPVVIIQAIKTNTTLGLVSTFFVTPSATANNKFTIALSGGTALTATDTYQIAYHVLGR